jgi:hypothetical protein
MGTTDDGSIYGLIESERKPWQKANSSAPNRT